MNDEQIPKKAAEAKARWLTLKDKMGGMAGDAVLKEIESIDKDTPFTGWVSPPWWDEMMETQRAIYMSKAMMNSRI